MYFKYMLEKVFRPPIFDLLENFSRTFGNDNAMHS